MGWACNEDGGDEKCMQNFGGVITRETITWKIGKEMGRT